MLVRKSRPAGRFTTTARSEANVPVHTDKLLGGSRLLGREAIDRQGVTRAKPPERLPTVLDRGEIECLFKHLEHPHKLVAALLYGGGLRLLEALRLRIQDNEHDAQQI